MRASCVLTPAQKLVWDEYRLLDQGEGAWVTANGLSVRLGIRDRSIERIRDELRGFGLLITEGRAPRVRYMVRLPGDCVPSHRPRDEEVRTLARMLDRILTGTVPETSPHQEEDDELPWSGGAPVRTGE